MTGPFNLLSPAWWSVGARVIIRLRRAQARQRGGSVYTGPLTDLLPPRMGAAMRARALLNVSLLMGRHPRGRW